MAEVNGSGEGETPQVVVAETIWINPACIVQFENRVLPNGSRILLFTLVNGRKYALELSGQILSYVQKAVSPVIAAGADQMPPGPPRG